MHLTNSMSAVGVPKADLIVPTHTKKKQDKADKERAEAEKEEQEEEGEEDEDEDDQAEESSEEVEESVAADKSLVSSTAYLGTPRMAVAALAWVARTQQYGAKVQKEAFCILQNFFQGLPATYDLLNIPVHEGKIQGEIVGRILAAFKLKDVAKLSKRSRLATRV